MVSAWCSRNSGRAIWFANPVFAWLYKQGGHRCTCQVQVRVWPCCHNVPNNSSPGRLHGCQVEPATTGLAKDIRITGQPRAHVCRSRTARYMTRQAGCLCVLLVHDTDEARHLGGLNSCWTTLGCMSVMSLWPIQDVRCSMCLGTGRVQEMCRGCVQGQDVCRKCVQEMCKGLCRDRMCAEGV